MTHRNDPGFHPNCPICGRALVYVTSVRRLRESADTHVYHCEQDGRFLLPPDGRFRTHVVEKRGRK
jgi:hypothetical protein